MTSEMHTSESASLSQLGSSGCSVGELCIWYGILREMYIHRSINCGSLWAIYIYVNLHPAESEGGKHGKRGGARPSPVRTDVRTSASIEKQRRRHIVKYVQAHRGAEDRGGCVMVHGEEGQEEGGGDGRTLRRLEGGVVQV